MPDTPPQEEKFHLVHEETKVKKDWEISDLYSKSWNIVKNNKVTWIFGAAVASMAAGSSSFRSNGSNLDTKDFQKIFNTLPSEATDSGKLSQVLGSSIDPLSALGLQIWNSIPVHYYVILAAEIIFLILMGIIIRYVYSAWANTGLINSVYTAFKGQKPTITESGQQSFKFIKPMVMLDLIPGLFYFLVILVAIIIFTLIFSFGDTASKIIFGILGFIGVIVALYLGFIMSLGLIWAQREVVVSGKGAKQAFWDGIKIAKKKKGGMIVLGIVNTLSTGLIGAIPIFIMALIFGGNVVYYLVTKTISPYLIGGSVIGVLVLSVLMVVLSAVIHAFKASVWTIAYDNIKGKYTNEK